MTTKNGKKLTLSQICARQTNWQNTRYMREARARESQLGRQLTSKERYALAEAWLFTAYGQSRPLSSGLKEVA